MNRFNPDRVNLVETITVTIPRDSVVLSAAEVERLREIARDLKMDEWCRIEGEAIDRVLDGDRS